MLEILVTLEKIDLGTGLIEERKDHVGPGFDDIRVYMTWKCVALVISASVAISTHDLIGVDIVFAPVSSLVRLN